MCQLQCCSVDRIVNKICFQISIFKIHHTKEHAPLRLDNTSGLFWKYILKVKNYNFHLVSGTVNRYEKLRILRHQNTVVLVEFKRITANKRSTRSKNCTSHLQMT